MQRDASERDARQAQRDAQRLRLGKPRARRQVELREEQDGRAERELSELARLPVPRGLNEVELSRGARLQRTLRGRRRRPLPRPRYARAGSREAAREPVDEPTIDA